MGGDCGGNGCLSIIEGENIVWFFLMIFVLLFVIFVFVVLCYVIIDMYMYVEEVIDNYGLLLVIVCVFYEIWLVCDLGKLIEVYF